MASEKIAAMIEEVKTLTVLELAELVHALEEEFGVSAAAAAVAAPAAGAGEAAAEEKTEFDVVLTEIGANKILEIKGGLIEGKVLSVDELKSFGDLPSKDALIAQVLGTFLAPISSLAVVLDQIRQQKEGPAPAEEAAEAAAE